ncbi:MAG: alpha-galactosidase [Candidatus Aminicenantes bacterium RBG_13_63_10]|nr:MAG: alpha-galactosidase [Candidatus Aminicenantes bacterium RBG_13_63_10]
MRKKLAIVAWLAVWAAAALSAVSCRAKETRGHLKLSDFDTLALKPPMGWNSWNKFGCDVDEEMVRRMAEAMVQSGMAAAGYEYVVIDDCWQTARDDEGNIIAGPERFPSGIKALADAVHSLGLKFGIYSCAGDKTCEGRPGSRGYEEKDARQYAAWGVDYLKYDWCHTEGLQADPAYKKMRAALEAAGRPIVFSICEWGRSKPWLWARGVGHLWRTTGDIKDKWESVLTLLDLQVGLEEYAGPGGWNDPDMLEVGNGGMTSDEYRAHFSLWCILAAPLMAGNDLRTMSRETAFILTNPDVIAVNQDALGVQGRRFSKEDDREIWVKPLADGSLAVALFNRGQSKARMSVSWAEMKIETSTCYVRDLWKRKELGRFLSGYSADVPSHAVVLVKVKPSNIID